MPNPFEDHFSQIAANYAQYRPQYPAALYEYLAEQAPGRALALDCATGSGQARDPQGQGQSAPEGRLDSQVYVPFERLPAGEEELIIPGQENEGGETQVREREDPLPGSTGPALVPYDEVYYEYLDAANRAMDQTFIPPELKDYVRDYFSQLEP